jgi:hypothetical protein
MSVPLATEKWAQAIDRTTPPSTRRAAPLIAEASGLADEGDQHRDLFRRGEAGFRTLCGT